MKITRSSFLQMQIDQQLKDERAKYKAQQKKPSMTKREFVRKLRRLREEHEKE